MANNSLIKFFRIIVLLIILFERGRSQSQISSSSEIFQILTSYVNNKFKEVDNLLKYYGYELSAEINDLNTGEETILNKRKFTKNISVDCYDMVNGLSGNPIWKKKILESYFEFESIKYMKSTIIDIKFRISTDSPLSSFINDSHTFLSKYMVPDYVTSYQNSFLYNSVDKPESNDLIQLKLAAVRLQPKLNVNYPICTGNPGMAMDLTFRKKN